MSSGGRYLASRHDPLDKELHDATRPPRLESQVPHGRVPRTWAIRLLTALLVTTWWSAPRPTHAQVSGDIQVAVIVIHFDDGLTPPHDAAYYEERIFTDLDSTSSYFQEVSASAVRLVRVDNIHGDVLGPVTIPHSGAGTCDYRQWSSAARQALPEIDFTRYDKIMYVIPPVCGWGDGRESSNGDERWLSNVGASPKGTTGVPAHEFGHNFDLHHANYGSSAKFCGFERRARARMGGSGLRACLQLDRLRCSRKRTCTRTPDEHEHVAG